jgi:hypothetical protein
VHRIALDRFDKQQNTALLASGIDLDQPARTVDGSLSSPASRSISLIHIKAAVLGADSFGYHERRAE